MYEIMLVINNSIFWIYWISDASFKILKNHSLIIQKVESSSPVTSRDQFSIYATTRYNKVEGTVEVHTYVWNLFGREDNRTPRASDRSALGAIMLVCRVGRQPARRKNIKISSYICINELRVEQY